MTESIENNDETLVDDHELNKFTSTLDEFTPAIPETVTRFYMQQCGLESDDDRVVKLLSVSVQKFMSDIVNDCFQLHKLREKSTNRPTGATAANVPSTTTEAAASTTDQATNAASGKKSVASTNQTLTLNDLTHVLGEYGINVKKTFYYT